MQTHTNSDTKTDYIDKAIYKVSESERKTKFDEETMKKSRKENDLNICVSINFVKVLVNETNHNLFPTIVKILSHLCLPPWSLHCVNNDSTLQISFPIKSRRH